MLRENGQKKVGVWSEFHSIFFRERLELRPRDAAYNGMPAGEKESGAAEEMVSLYGSMRLCPEQSGNSYKLVALVLQAFDDTRNRVH